MGALFRLTGNNLLPAPGSRVIKSADLAILYEGQAILDAARQRAAEIELAAEEASELRRQEGYDDGVLEGRMEHMEKMLETAMQAVEYLESLEESLVRVVGGAVRKIIGELDDNERIVRVVRNALVTVRNQQRVLVRVAPSDEAAVRESLGVMLKSAPGGVSFLDMSPDPRMSPGECMLESELGVVDASLETQFRALEHALASKITRG